MKQRRVRTVASLLAATMMLSGVCTQVQAGSLSSVLPSAGIGLTLGGTSLTEVRNTALTKKTNTTSATASVAQVSKLKKVVESASAKTLVKTKATATDTSSIAIASTSIAGAFGIDTSSVMSAVTALATNSSSLAGTNIIRTNIVSIDEGDTAVSPTIAEEETLQALMAQEETVSEETTSVVELATVSAEETLDAEAEALKSMDITETALKSTDVSANEPEEEETEEADPEHFSNLVIANVNDYVNVRDLPSEEGNIVGKLYDDSVGTFISETDGWYLIQSGNTTGYVKGEFCVTGEDAIALAKEVGTRMATVTTTTLKVRQDPSTEAVVLGLVPIDEDLVVTEELDGWVKVNIEEGDGYVSTDYVNLWTDFVTAESKEEEEARLAKEKAEREAARKAAAAAQAAAQKKQQSSSGSTPAATQTVTSGGSEAGIAVANYALQFVGNPYVYGGTSLTNGADCSGFVMSVYANFGVSLPHSSKADRSVGSAVASLAEAQPGDLICYSGHVALYIGNGQIVHASTSRTGIIVSSASYRTPLAIRRIF